MWTLETKRLRTTVLLITIFYQSVTLTRDFIFRNICPIPLLEGFLQPTSSPLPAHHNKMYIPGHSLFSYCYINFGEMSIQYACQEKPFTPTALYPIHLVNRVSPNFSSSSTEMANQIFKFSEEKMLAVNCCPRMNKYTAQLFLTNLTIKHDSQLKH